MDAAGLMQMPRMFENLPNISMFPTPETAMLGAEQAKWGKEPFKMTSYNVRVLDMSKDHDRDEYCKLMVRLTPLCQDAKAVVVKNELQLLNGLGWWRYVEWFEYELNKTSLTRKADDKDKEDTGVVDKPVSDSTDNDLDGIW